MIKGTLACCNPWVTKSQTQMSDWTTGLLSEVAQSCPTLCDPMDYTVHGILQARILEWVAISFSRDLPNPGIVPGSPALQADALLSKPPGKHASVQFSSVAQLCPTLCNPMNCSTPGLPVHHQLPEFTQTHIHRVSDAIQPSHPLSSPSPPAPSPSLQERILLGQQLGGFPKE